MIRLAPGRKQYSDEGLARLAGRVSVVERELLAEGHLPNDRDRRGRWPPNTACTPRAGTRDGRRLSIRSCARHWNREESTMKRRVSIRRRGILAGIAASPLMGLVTGAPGGAREARAGEPLARTPSQPEGPYYPVAKPPSPGNDLLHRVGGARAEGVPLRLEGRVLRADGTALAGIKVEIWQADDRGIYRHPRAPGQGREDPGFAGYGETVTDEAGAYVFLTIVPVIYTSRPPHVHVKVKPRGARALTTQLYLRGHPANERDGLLSRLVLRHRERLLIDPRPATLAQDLNGQQASFDFVV
jgi:protocatechuate 3,4-dioxygenase beta subunit